MNMETAAPPSADEEELIVLPVSPAQARMWFLDRLGGGSAAYTIPGAVRLRGTLDPRALTAALAAIVQRHEVLRTTFPAIDGEPVQVVHPSAAVRWDPVDLSALPDAERAAEAARIARAEARRPFDLARGPLLRTVLIRLSPDEHLALCTLHHIVADGWSLGVLQREIAAGYAAAAAGTDAHLPELPLQYGDFAEWQQSWLRGAEAARQLAYWTGQLAGAPVLELPADRPRPEEPDFRGGQVEFRLGDDVLRGVRALGARHGATPMVTLLAAFKVLLARCTGQADVVVGTPVAGRSRKELEALIGLFANTLALRTDLGGDTSFDDVVARVRQTVVAAQTHQDLPFDRVVDALRDRHDPRRNPLFEVEFVYVSAPRDALRLADLAFSADPVPTGSTRFDLELHLVESPAGLDGRLVYRACVFDRATVERMAGHFTRLLSGALAAPGAPIATLPLLADDERREMVEGWNRPDAPDPADRCIHELFAEQAARTPDAPAVLYGDATLSFGELDRRANRLANRLRRMGVGPETRVGLCLERGPELMPALLGVLKTGGAYVPVDPGHPADRIAYALEDSAVAVLLTQERLRARIPERAGMRILALDTDGPAAEPGDEDAPETGVLPENLCYVIYTSGSTGRPKGVAMHHRGVCNYVRWGIEAYGANQGNGAPVFSSMAVDLTLTNLLPLFAGRPVHLLPEQNPVEALAEVLRGRPGFGLIKITPIHLSLLTALLAPDEARGAAHVLVIGGEVLPAELTVWWQENAPGVRLVNEYGPTETVVGCSAYTLAPGVHRGGPVPVGRAIRNLTFFVLDGRLQPVPVGVAGELYVGGTGVARGYLDRPALSADRFVPDPFAGPGARMYRTGDRARWLAGGSLMILGRTDHQVKVRGYRVELGEVEAVLRRHPGVSGALVVLREDVPGDRRLVAYVVTDEDAAALRAGLRRTLPEHMVPSAFVRLDALPQTATGKVDPRTLPAPAYGGAKPDPVEPRTPLEALLAGMWAEVLGAERIGAHDDFFELGGNSLLVMRVAARVRTALGVDVPLRVLLARTTLAGLAEWIAAAEGAAAPAPAAISRADRSKPLPLSFPQERLWFLDRAQDTGAGFTTSFGVRMEGPGLDGDGLDGDALERAFGLVVARHEVLRTAFPAEDGEARQQVLSPAPFALARADLRDRAEDARAAALATLSAELAERPFDLSRGPLLRALLVRTDAGAHVLLVALHHVVFDGWSAGVLIRELAAGYEATRAGRAPALPALPVQYADYAAWQRAWAATDEAAAQLAYWKRQLAGLVPLDLAAGRARPESAGYAGAALPVELGAERTARVRALAREGQSTVFMTLLAAFKVVLAHHGRTRDLAVGTDLAGRVRPELEGLIGFFINEVVLRTDLSGDLALREVLDRVRGVALDAFRNQDLPFALLVKELGGRRTLGATPLFQVMFGLDNTPAAALEMDGLRLTPVDASAAVSPWELSLYLRDADGGITGTLRYRTALFDGAAVEDLRGDFLAVVDALCHDPGARMGAVLQRLADGERARWQARARAREDAARQRLRGARRPPAPVGAD
jgi:amino acid adenylation domain-containing protein